MKADPFNQSCPSRDILELIGGKWSMLLLCSMRQGPVRTGELRRKVDGISQKMLTQTLRDLERNGIVQRISYPEIPPRVEYKLTRRGHSLGELIAQIEHWVMNNYGHMKEAQRTFDSVERAS